MDEYPGLTRSQSSLSLRDRRSQSREPIPYTPRLTRARSIADFVDEMKAVYKAPSRPLWPYRCYRDNYLFDNYHYDHYYFVSPHYYSPPARRYTFMPLSSAWASHTKTYPTSRYSSKYSEEAHTTGTSYLRNPNRWSGLLPYAGQDRYWSSPSYWYPRYRDWRSAIGYKNNYASEYYTRRYRPVGRWLY